MSLIQAENLTKVYGTGDTAVTALDHANLSVNAGEFVAELSERWRKRHPSADEAAPAARPYRQIGPTGRNLLPLTVVTS